MGLRGDIETQTDGWLALANKCLQLIEARSDCVNVIVTQTQVIMASTKYDLYFHNVFCLVGGRSYKNIVVWTGALVSSGKCLLGHKNWKGFLFREDHAEIWTQVNLCCRG